MSYVLGGKIEASDYNGFVGIPASGNNALSKFTSEATANGKLGAIWGVGYGRWGWGQTSNPISTVSQGDIITATQWDNVGNIVTACGARLNAVSTTGIDNAIAAGDPILFQSTLSSTISAINSNKNSTNQPGGVYSAVLYEQTLTTSWNTAKDIYVSYTFSSGDQARYFFNTGSWLMIRPRIVSTPITPQDTAWQTFLNEIGDIRIFGETASRTGTAGTIAGSGYWDYNASTWTVLMDVTSGSGAYTSDLRFYCAAKINGATNVSGNGDNGAVVDVRVYFDDFHNSGWPGEGVSANLLNVKFYTYRYTSQFSPPQPASVLAYNNF